MNHVIDALAGDLERIRKVALPLAVLISLADFSDFLLCENGVFVFFAFGVLPSSH
jgi:hypothetical protein